MEKGGAIRVDAAAVAAEGHAATDYTLVKDGIRGLTRRLLEGKTRPPVPTLRVLAHERAGRGQVLKILQAKKEKVRLRA